MSIRPITDVWILGRSKTKQYGKNYFGAYPAGFLERARPLLVGGNPYASVWHVCGGMARKYNGGPEEKGGITLSGFGIRDITIDIDPLCEPDILWDVRRISELGHWHPRVANGGIFRYSDEGKKAIRNPQAEVSRPDAILIDRPYGLEEATHYRCGPDVLPDINQLLKDCLQLVLPGGHVGVIDYVWPHPGEKGKEVAAIAVGTGRNNRARWFTIFKSK